MPKTTDFLFHAGLILKGIDASFEVVGGVLLMTPTKILRLVDVVTQHDLFRHHLALTGRIDHLAENVSMNASVLEATYLLIHGLAKVILIAAIFRGARWGYIGLIVILSIFACIEVTRAITAREVVTGIFGLFDFAVVVLIAKEYRMRFSNHPESQG